MDIHLLIQHENALLLPVVAEGVMLTLERKNTPGKLTFSAVQDEALQLGEGDAVKLTVDGTVMFYGFIFRLKRTEGETVEVTAYDQLYYLKNKDSFVGEGLTASELLTQLAADFRLNLGEVTDTGYKLPVIDEQNQTLFDMISNALAETLTRTGQLYVLFDEGGRLCLKGIEALRLGLLIDADTGESLGVAPIGHVVTVEGVQAAEVSVGLRLSCRAGWDFAAAKPYLEEAIAGYFKELAESWADEEEPLVVRISGIESRVLALAGILDVTGTVLNSSEGNLTLPPDSIPLLSEVSEWTGG